MVLTQKESLLLQDLKSGEQLCVDKYTKYANDSCDQGLKDLFNQIGQAEQHHLDTINQIISGTIPQVNSGASGGQIQPQAKAQTDPMSKQKDQYLCSDALSTEKHVSSVYDTCIFEFSDPNIRNVLNHIQKEEQEHGEKIYNYMAQNGMYN